MKAPYWPSLLMNLAFAPVATLGLTHCGGSGHGLLPEESTIAEAEYAYESWPNETTSDSSSASIASKVLLSDLDLDGVFENVFISVLPNSSNKKSSVLRVTQGADFTEVVNYKANRIHLYQESIPFSIDIDQDGARELVFVSYDRDKVYAFEFKKNNLKNLFVRWSAELPAALDEDFDRQLTHVRFEGKDMVKVGPYGLHEYKKKKVRVFELEE